MNRHLTGSEAIRVGVTFFDFVIVNLLFLLLIEGNFINVPRFFFDYTKVTFLLLNITLAIAEYFFGTILHRHMVAFTHVSNNILHLTVLHALLFFIFIKVVDSLGDSLFIPSLTFFFLEFIIILFSRAIELSVLKRLRSKGYNSRSVLLVGHDPAIRSLYNDLVADISLGYRVVGYYADKEGAFADTSLPHLGTLDQLEALMQKEDTTTVNPSTQKTDKHPNPLKVDEIFCCISHDYSQTVINIMHYCDRHLIRFFYLPRQFGVYRLNLKPLNFYGVDVFTNLTEPLENPFNRWIKRLFDVLFSSVVCICLLPFIPIIGLIIKLQSPGPIFFKQARTGLNGKTFMCYKFRSMHVNKDADRVQATEHDVRKFKFGDFMRRTNIDELPQFFNVLKGDMSVVGPRPHMLYHTEVYSKIIDKYMVRHFCKPGITGLAQIRGCRGETKELWQMEERVHYDIWYIEHWTFTQDLYIIAKTVLNVFEHDEHAY
ncbi:MAG: exopolysaccharide biosynthesis polyprenyl glycosylphosphotransferase [Prevotella sp.]|jgi:putative colanic acid biosynthesis UDP-glucose lipid carrier transferase